jgi:TonB family protein
MNRLQKKCFIAAAGLHLSLVTLLLVGPAFLSSKPPETNIQPIDFMPSKVIEQAITGGGNPNANPLPPTRPPTPQVVAVPPAPPERPTEVVKQETPKVESPDSLEVKKDKPKTPQISTKLVVRNNGKTTSKTPADSKENDARRQAADQFNRSLTGLRNNLAPTTTFDLRGPGGGGETYAGFDQNLLSIYDRAWISPEGMDGSEAVVGVKVVIESNGSISSARIIQPSGDARVDRSVQQALDRVTSVPVPETMKSRRTVEFNFRPRAKPSI